MAQKRGIFFEPKYRKYAEIVRIDSPQAARESVKELDREAREAKRPSKVRRILRVVVLAANRAEASAKRKNISPKEKRELKQVAKIYRAEAKRLSALLKRMKAKKG